MAKAGPSTSTSKKVKKPEDKYFKDIFKEYDTNHDGYMELTELQEMVRKDNDVSKRLVKRILNISDTDRDGKLNYPEFRAMVQNENLKEIFGRYMNSYIRLIVPRQRHRRVATREVGSAHELGSAHLDESLRLDDTDGLYEENYAFCPPPFAMLVMSAFELACFLTDELNWKDSTKTASGVTAAMFIYDPHKRFEFWRFFTYMFVHIGYFHLVVNLIVQLLLGLPLEMVHKWWRILLVYFSGVVAGSLATSITDPTAYLAGASGGVYAIMTAHIATIIMNWSEMTFPVVVLLMFMVIIVGDVGTSIYNRYWLDRHDHIGYAAHFAGAIAGLLVGIWVLKNFVPTKKELYLWWFALVVYVLLMGTMIALNFALTDYWPK